MVHPKDRTAAKPPRPVSQQSRIIPKHVSPSFSTHHHRPNTITMTEIKIPAGVFDAMITAASKRLKDAKSIIIQDDTLHYKMLTERYDGNIEVAAWATKSRPFFLGADGEVKNKS